MKKIISAAFLLTACGDVFEQGLFLKTDGGSHDAHDDTGMAGQAGASAGAPGGGGQAGQDGAVSGAGGGAAVGAMGGGTAAGAGGSGGSDPCPPGSHVSIVGSFCVDKQPNLKNAAAQGSNLAYLSVVAACEARGMRLCTQQERESNCPGGQEPAFGANDEFCKAPASDTWEWSSTSCTNPGHCRTPCCNSVNYPCDTNTCNEQLQEAAGYHCCKDLP